MCAGSGRLAGVNTAAPGHLLQLRRCQTVVLQYDVTILLLLFLLTVPVAVVTTEFEG